MKVQEERDDNVKQAVMWKNKVEFDESEDQQKVKKVLDRNCHNRDFLQRQMDDKKGVKKVAHKMNDLEKKLNRNLLKEIKK